MTEVSKANAYAVIKPSGPQVSKANSYAVLRPAGPQVSKTNAYAVLRPLPVPRTSTARRRHLMTTTFLTPYVAPVVPPIEAGPSYYNAGGLHNRVGTITVTSTKTIIGGPLENLVNPGIDPPYFDNFGAGAEAPGNVRFDFGVGKKITEITWLQDIVGSHGMWRVRGSDDATAWTDLSSDFDLGSVTTQIIPLTNDAFFRYYEFYHVSGTVTREPFLMGAEFKLIQEGGEPTVTAYTNYGATGDRSRQVVLSSPQASPDGIDILNASIAALINGNTGENAAWFKAGETSGYLQFDFLVPIIVDEAKWYQSTAATQGTWQFSGSNDGATYTPIGASFVLGDVATQTITALNGNTVAYRYLRMTLVGGATTSSPYTREIEFKTRYAPAIAPAGFTAKLLMRFDGSAIDEQGHVFNAADVDYVTGKFGQGLDLSYTTDVVTSVDAGLEFAVGSEDFTLEFWAYWHGNLYDAVVGCYNTDTAAPDRSYAIGFTPGYVFAYASNGNAGADMANIVIEVDGDTVYRHLCFERSGSTFRFYIDGVVVGTATSTLAVRDPVGPFRVGGPMDGSGSRQLGSVDELRLVIGTAVYDSDAGFAVPTAPPLPNDFVDGSLAVSHVSVEVITPPPMDGAARISNVAVEALLTPQTDGSLGLTNAAIEIIRSE